MKQMGKNKFNMMQIYTEIGKFQRNAQNCLNMAILFHCLLHNPQTLKALILKLGLDRVPFEFNKPILKPEYF